MKTLSPSLQRAISDTTLTAIKREIKAGITSRKAFVARNLIPGKRKRRGPQGGRSTKRMRQALGCLMADLG